jgi:hypothetical protein
MVRYTFTVWDFHPLLLAGLPAHWHLLKEKTSVYAVIPAKAGIQGLKKHRPIGRFWMPAFAGMTEFQYVGLK